MQPPRLATWLLRHLGSSPHNDSIIGDLIEQYHTSPSIIWYWKQCLKAIATALLNECRTHKWLTLRALITGWTVLLVISPQSFGPIRELLFALEVWSRWWRHSWLLPLTWTFHAMLVCLIAGWLIARSHRPYQVQMVLMFTVSFCVVMWPIFFVRATDNRPWWPTDVLPVLEPICIMFGGGLLRSRQRAPGSSMNKHVAE
jgi:hypothetical protein